MHLEQYRRKRWYLEPETISQNFARKINKIIN